jgi:DNA-binding beta-propeller fold protein YncE
VAVDRAGTVYVADSRNHCLRYVSPEGLVSTLAGIPGVAGLADGPGTEAQFSHPAGLALLADGSLLVADTGNHRIRRVSPDGDVVTIAGHGTPRDDLGREHGGYRDGPTHEALFRFPIGLAVTHVTFTEEGMLWVADSVSGRLWAGPLSGPLRRWGTEENYRQLTSPAGVAAGEQVGFPAGLIVVDSRGNCLWAVDGEAESLLCGSPESTAAEWKDGPGPEARFNRPAGVAVGPNGELYVADYGNNCLRQVVISVEHEEVE